MSAQEQENWGAASTGSNENEGSQGGGPYPFGEEKANRGCNWNDPEMQALLILLKEEADTNPADFHNTYRKGPIYRRISERMKAIGFNRRPDQIQCKTKKWKSLYINVLKQRAKGKRVTCRYFKDLVEIFGDTADKLGASAAAEGGDDTVEVELSHGAAVAANRNSDSPPPRIRIQNADGSVTLQQPRSGNRTARKILQRSLALQRLSQKGESLGVAVPSSGGGEFSQQPQPSYPPPDKAELVHFVEATPDESVEDDSWQSFLLDNGLLKLHLLEEEFGLSRIKIKIESHWVRLTTDDNGYIPLTFAGDSSHVIRGIRKQGPMSRETVATAAQQQQQQQQQLHHHHHHQNMNHMSNAVPR